MTPVYKFWVIFSSSTGKGAMDIFNRFWDAEFESTARKNPSGRIFKI